MAAYEDFNVQDTKPGDIFKDNNPVALDRTYWIIINRNPNNVFMRGYNLDTKMIIPNITFYATLDDLNNDYTYIYIRRNPAGGRRRRSRKSKRTRRSKKRVKRSRKSRRY